MRKKRKSYLIRIGPGHAVLPSAIQAILGADIARSEKLMSGAIGQGLLIDTCCGHRKVRSLIILETGHMLLSSVESETMIARMAKSAGKNEGHFPNSQADD